MLYSQSFSFPHSRERAVDRLSRLQAIAKSSDEDALSEVLSEVLAHDHRSSISCNCSGKIEALEKSRDKVEADRKADKEKYELEIQNLKLEHDIKVKALQDQISKLNSSLSNLNKNHLALSSQHASLEISYHSLQTSLSSIQSSQSNVLQHFTECIEHGKLAALEHFQKSFRSNVSSDSKSNNVLTISVNESPNNVKPSSKTPNKPFSIMISPVGFIGQKSEVTVPNIIIEKIKEPTNIEHILVKDVQEKTKDSSKSESKKNSNKLQALFSRNKAVLLQGTSMHGKEKLEECDPAL